MKTRLDVNEMRRCKYVWTNDISYTYMMQSEWEKEMEKMKETKKEVYKATVMFIQQCERRNEGDIRNNQAKEKRNHEKFITPTPG